MPSDRYASPEMRAIFSDQGYIDRMVQVEMEHLTRTHPEVNRDLDGDVKAAHSIIAEHVRLVEKERTGHEVTALLSIIDDILGHSHVHTGLTSSDVTDTARAMQMKDAQTLLVEALGELVTFLDNAAFQNAEVPIIARTHGQYAVPSTLGHRMTNWAYLLRIAGYELDESMKSIRGKLSGAVGTHVFVDKRDFEVTVCATVDAYAAGYSTQIVPRTLWLKAWNSVLGAIVACEKVANDLRILAADGIEEFNPPAPRHSSSTMTHKQNPATLERVIGLSRLGRHLHHALSECVGDNWLERDLTNTSVERIAVPQLYTYAECAISTLRKALQNGTWDTAQMNKNLDAAIKRGALREFAYVTALDDGVPRNVARTFDVIPDPNEVLKKYVEAAANDVRRGRTS